ncbi:3'-5' exonuclease [Kocuria atrinae]|uniref:3'-5' exonuclease n=1 Tax=Kocuria atrinae TaxID=592377 RepID=UPI0002F9C932|nr:3'-5' exonuclease [Kocuria atrinae]
MPVSFTAIDFETANRSFASACAVGVVRVQDGRVADTQYSLLRPPPGHDHFEPGNIRVHGIRPADVAGAPSYAQYWQWLVDRLDADDPDGILVAHNAVFDTGVIRAANRAVGQPARPWRYACTLRLSRAAYQLRSYSLPAVSHAVGVTLENHHNALADAQACAGIVMDLARRSAADSMEELTAHYGNKILSAEL